MTTPSSKTKKSKRIMREFEIHEISGVDNPAQVGARALIMKSVSKQLPMPMDGEDCDMYMARFMEDETAKAQYGDEEQRRHAGMNLFAMKDVTDTSGADLSRARKREFSSEQREELAESGEAMPDGSFPIENAEDLRNAIQAFGRAKNPEAVAKHIRRRAKALGLTELLPDEGRLASIIGKMEAAAGGEENTMADDVALKVAEQRLTELQAQIALFKSIAEMTDAQKAHYNGLSEAGRSEFVKLAPERRAEIVTAAKAADPVVYTSADGTEFRKSDSAVLVAMAKRNDELAAELVAAKAARDNDRLEKLAGETMSHLPGELTVKTTLLRAVEGIADEKLRKGALEILTAAESAFSGGFEVIGVSSAPQSTSANARLDEMAKAEAAKSNVSYEQAYAKSLQTPEGRRLYREASIGN